VKHFVRSVRVCSHGFRRHSLREIAVLLALCIAGAASPAGAQNVGPGTSSDHRGLFPATPDTTKNLPPAEVVPRRPLAGIGEIVGINVLVWSYDRFLRSGDTSGFDIGPDSWWDNLRHGFEFDDNHFNTNQWAHPFQGNLYFNTGRTNGYEYWQSMPFAFLGSFMWEYMMEANPPAINDWINTSVGGSALGESFYRFSSLILDNTDSGTSRVFREIGAAVVNPVRGFNRLIHGRSGKVTQNPADWRTNYLKLHLLTGALAATEEGNVSDSTNAYIEFDVQYGNPFDGAYKKPFQTFEFQAQVDLGSGGGLNRAQAEGILYGIPLGEKRPAENLIAFWQRYDYINSPPFELGGQSATAGWLGAFGSPRYRFIADAELGWTILSATLTDYPDFTGREYDYGMGPMGHLEFDFLWRGRPVALVRHTTVWQETLNGNSGRHLLSFTRARLNIPFTDFVGVGGEYLLYQEDSDYEDFPDVNDDTSEFRLFLNWHI